MDNLASESVDFANIRQTIRHIILPLVQAIYDENPSDVIQFCSGYFNTLFQQRESDQQMMNMLYGGENSPKREKHHNNFESKESEMLPLTTLQESASDPVLKTNNRTENVNLRGKTSSWDTPSNFIEPIKSIAVLEDAACGIGDQPSPVEKCLGLENAAKAGDACTHLKDDSAYEDDSFNEYVVVDEIKIDEITEGDLKPTYTYRESTDDDIKTLCTQFECMKTEISDALKLDDSKDDNSVEEEASKNDVKICKKQLSPNSSFGFVPNLKECDSKGEMKEIDFEDPQDKNLKAKAEEISMIAMEVSQTFHDLAEEMNNTEINFDENFQKAKEISDIIQGQNNVNAVDISNNIPNKISNYRDVSWTGKPNITICSNLDKRDNVTDDETSTKKVNDIPVIYKMHNESMAEYIKPKENEYENLKTNYQEEQNPAKEKSVNKIDVNNDENKSDQAQSQTVVDKLWRKKWYEAHPSLSNLNNSWRRDPRLLRANFSACKPNIGEAGDVPLDRLHTSNEASNDQMNGRSRNQINSESSTNTREYINSRCFSDETNHRSSSAKRSDSLSERKSSSERMSNANPQSIPYAWRNLCKQSHSSESMISKESQIKLNERTCSSTKSETDKNISSFDAADKTCEANVTESKEVFFETSDKLPDERSLVIQESKERNKKQTEDKIKDDVLNGSVSNQNRNITTTNQSDDCPIKDEPCLNAACGDFAYSTNNANEFQETNRLNENEQRYESREGISLEYVGEIIERINEQQSNDSKDSYEGLNFSNDTESGSSYAESSDFSETDDFSMNDSMQGNFSLNDSMQDK